VYPGFVAGRDDDRWNPNTPARKILLNLQSGHPRHLEIEDQTIRQRFRQRSEKLLTRLERYRREGARAQEPRHRF
jgi:hypothetical protein